MGALNNMIQLETYHLYKGGCQSVCVSVCRKFGLSHIQLHNNIIDGGLNMVEMWCEPVSGWLWVLCTLISLSSSVTRVTSVNSLSMKLFWGCRWDFFNRMFWILCYMNLTLLWQKYFRHRNAGSTTKSSRFFQTPPHISIFLPDTPFEKKSFHHGYLP